MHPDLFTIPGINFTVPSYGFMWLVSFLGATYWMTRRASKVKADPDIVLNLAFFVLIFGAVGGRAFYVLHHWESEFAHNPGLIFNIRAGGFELYGGLIGAFFPIILYLWYKRLSIRLYADLMAPSILLGMGIGRIGCFLVGCCWGGPASEALPWAVRFPFGSPAYMRQWQERQVTAPAELIIVDSAGSATPVLNKILQMGPEDLDKLKEKVDQQAEALEKAKAEGDEKKIKLAEANYNRFNLAVQSIFNHFEIFETTPAQLCGVVRQGNYCTHPVHPSQIYGAVGPLLLAWLTGAYFYRRKRHGTVVLLAVTLYAVERFIEEVIRIDNPRDTFGLTASQAISIAVFVIGIIGFLIARKLPLRSPRAVPCKAAVRKKDDSSTEENI